MFMILRKYLPQRRESINQPASVARFQLRILSLLKKFPRSRLLRIVFDGSLPKYVFVLGIKQATIRMKVLNKQATLFSLFFNVTYSNSSDPLIQCSTIKLQTLIDQSTLLYTFRIQCMSTWKMLFNQINGNCTRFT